MLKFSEFFEFSSENSYFERIRTVRMVRIVRMVRSLADRTFQLWYPPWPPPAPPGTCTKTPDTAIRNPSFPRNMDMQAKNLGPFFRCRADALKKSLSWFPDWISKVQKACWSYRTRKIWNEKCIFACEGRYWYSREGAPERYTYLLRPFNTRYQSIPAIILL